MSRDDVTRAPDPGGAPDNDRSLDAVDDALRRLPPLPAPTATVQRTLERVALARAQRTSARPFGWALMAAASVLAVVGAWLSVRSGDVARSPTSDGNLARVENSEDGGPERGRYRLRRLDEIKEINGLDLANAEDQRSADAWVQDTTRGLMAEGERFDYDAKQAGQDGTGMNEAGLGGLALVPAREKSGKLNQALSDALKAPPGWDSGVRVPSGSAAPTSSSREELLNLEGREQGQIRLATTPESGEILIDGKATWAVSSRDANQPVIADPEPADPAVVDLPHAGPAVARVDVARVDNVAGDFETVRSGEDQRVAGTDEVPPPHVAGNAAPVEDGRYTVTIDQPGFSESTVVVTRETVAKEAAKGEDANKDTDKVDKAQVSTLVVAVDKVEEKLAEEDEEERSRDATLQLDDDETVAAPENQRGPMYWRNADGDGERGGEVGDATELVVTQLPAKVPHRGEPAQAHLAGKRAIPTRQLVPPADAVEGLEALPNQGYYRNTYQPGDAETRWLRASLTERLTRDGVDLPLERAARPPVQPFAAPDGQGMGLSVTADRLAAAGPTRMTVQIGLAGADRVASRRAPLNLALVLDVAAIRSEADRQALWSLADALVTSKQPGDRFAVVVTGAATGDGLLASTALTGPEVRRALASVYETRVSPTAGDVDLDAAFGRALKAVRSSARDGAPLGADVVVVATPRAVAATARAQLEERARGAALGGVHVSAIGIGGGSDAAALAGLAEAGQGRRLLASDSEGARSVMARELAASGRAVARAVRLRVRLADGVKLVGVLGSERLDVVAAERVREAEKAIDRQVREATGIASDRGDDEDGIQIVIPAFYAGDRHVVLLDVVAPGPGPLVDVRARFKDLVALDNGEASASLALGAHPGEVTPSPATRNVVANRAAFSIGEALLEASRALDRGDRGAAFDAIFGARAGLTALEGSEPALAAALAADRALLDQYVALLGDAPAWGDDPTLVAWVSRSLRLAARVKGLL